MIPRYSRSDMSKIWGDDSRFQIWLDIETLALEKMVELGLAPAEALQAVKQKAKFNSERVLEIEKEVKHDVIAFLTNVAESVGPLSRFLHRGMTSSDVLDTALAVQLVRSGKLILAGLDALLSALKSKALEFKHTPCIGRSHGIHAEPTTFGLKLIGFYAEFKRQRDRFEQALSDIAAGKISGPVGTFATVSPEVESYVMKKLGLKPEEVSTQIVARDRHAVYFSALAWIGCSIERLAVEIRHLQRSEVREAEENFTKGQKGSSSMPHKRNPVLSENISGLARLLRSYAQAAMENVTLWHERDISHSSVERIMGPDACILCDFMLHRATGIVRDLVVYPERMLENMESGRGLIFSGTLLNALVDKGVTREDAYKLVQKHALAAWEGGADFKTRVSDDAQLVSTLGKETLAQVFDIKRHFAQVDFIFERALNS